jgi:hypothetical protein
MGRGARERDALRALARKVWGESYYEHQVRQRARRGQRLVALVGIGVGSPLLLTALVLAGFSTTASAHTSTINISCTQVEFVYDSFPDVTATSHESVSIDGVEVATRDFTFEGPSATDVISISVGSGTHTVDAHDQWSFDGQPQGQADASQELSDCATTSTTMPKSSTTESSTTTVPKTSTTESTTTTSTTVPKSSTSASTSTSTSSSTSTTRSTSTTIGSSTTSTVHEQGSTSTTRLSTSSTVHEQGSTSTTTTSTPKRNLPFTGSGGLSLAAGLAALGVGMLAVGMTSLRRSTGGN